MTILLTRCLDAIHEYVKTRLFSQIALSIALKHNLLKKTAHLDTTTLSVYGDYDFVKMLHLMIILQLIIMTD